MTSTITVRLKSWMTFLYRVPPCYFLEINSGAVSDLYIRPRDGVDACFFGFTKMVKFAKMTPNEFFTEPPTHTKQKTLLVS